MRKKIYIISLVLACVIALAARFTGNAQGDFSDIAVEAAARLSGVGTDDDAVLVNGTQPESAQNA